MALIEFTRNHNDLSTDRGFQLEFFCDRCGSGYQSTFKGSASGAVTDALDTEGGTKIEGSPKFCPECGAKQA